MLVRAGTYYQPQPLSFEPQDSGTAESPIFYKAYPGERVTLSGGRKLECRWKPFSNGIMMCSLPEAKRSRLAFTQLFVNGKRQTRARYPNYDASHPLVSGTGYIDVGRDEEKWPATEFHYDPATFTKRRWTKPKEAVVHIFPLDYWGNLQWQVKDVDWEDHAVKLGWGGFQVNELVFGKAGTAIGRSQLYHGAFASRFFIENVFEELDAPGEWYWDRNVGALYYMRETGVDLDHATVEVPVLDRVIEFRGTQLDPVKYITLSGFRIAQTASTFLEEYDAPSLGDWTIHRGGAIFLDGAEDCGIENCFLDAVGGNAVFVNNYNRRIRVSGNKITAAGDSAICLVGARQKIQGTNRALPAENIVSN
ncbi:MAG: right-handed parallel beta-helix repeat-containing protein, partial [Candidatus Dormibacteraceae bacterium]